MSVEPTNRSAPQARSAWILGIAAAIALLVWDPAAPAADPKRALLLLVAAVALATTPRPAWPVKVPVAAPLFAAFAAAAALTQIWGQGSGWRDLGTLTGAAVLLSAASLRPREEARAMARATASVLGGGAALWTLLQASAGARGLALHGGQGNPNWLGLVLAVTFPLSLSALLDAPRGSRGERVLVLLVVPQIPALLLAQSRTAWVALAIAGALSLAGRRAPLKPGVALGAALAIGGATVLLVAHGAAHSLEGRIWIWRLAARAAADALPWGAGLGAFPVCFLAAQGDALSTLPIGEAARRFVNATTAHDDWLQIAIETGLPGVMLLGSALGAGVVACRRSGARAEAATLIAFAVAALGDSPLRQPAVLAPVVLCLASAPRSLRLAGTPLRVSVVVVALGLAAAGGVLPIAGSSWLGARLATSARDAPPDLKLALLLRAERVDPRSGEIAFAAGIALLERGAPDAALADIGRSRALLFQVATEVAIGNARLLGGDANGAVMAYESALRIDPGSFRAHANLAVALRRLGREDEADRHLRAARLIWPHHPALAEIAAQWDGD